MFTILQPVRQNNERLEIEIGIRYGIEHVAGLDQPVADRRVPIYVRDVGSHCIAIIRSTAVEDAVSADQRDFQTRPRRIVRRVGVVIETNDSDRMTGIDDLDKLQRRVLQNLDALQSGRTRRIAHTA